MSQDDPNQLGPLIYQQDAPYHYQHPNDTTCLINQQRQPQPQIHRQQQQQQHHPHPQRRPRRSRKRSKFVYRFAAIFCCCLLDN